MSRECSKIQTHIHHQTFSWSRLASRAPLRHFCAIIARHTCDLYRGHACIALIACTRLFPSARPPRARSLRARRRLDGGKDHTARLPAGPTQSSVAKSDDRNHAQSTNMLQQDQGRSRIICTQICTISSTGRSWPLRTWPYSMRATRASSRLKFLFFQSFPHLCQYLIHFGCVAVEPLKSRRLLGRRLLGCRLLACGGLLCRRLLGRDQVAL